MTDATSADMARFFQRYDTRHRLLFTAALSAGLALSAVNLIHGMPGDGGARATTMWGFAILFSPLFTLVWWAAMELIARYRRGLPPTGADEARGGVRIANAGFFYSLALMAMSLATQATVTLSVLGYSGGGWIQRAAFVGVGAALICLGNVWPRMPTPQGPKLQSATRMRIHRIWGWVMVIIGLVAVVQGLFPPVFHGWLGWRP